MMSLLPVVIVNSRGMITIPIEFRKKHNIKPGTKVMVLEMDEGLSIIPILNEKELQEDLIPAVEMKRTTEEAKIHDLEIEE